MRKTSGQPDSTSPWLLATLSGLAVANVVLPADSVAAQLGAGLPMVVVTLLLACAWLGWGVVRRSVVVRFGPVELAVVALLAWHSLAALFAVRHGAPRPAINMLWQWVGLGAWFLVARQLLRTPSQCHALLAVMVAVSIVQSVFGFWQLRYELPATREVYQQLKAKQATLPLPGQDVLMDATMRNAFESRLDTQEPPGTFSLTNSLAGFLAVWLVMGIGIAWSLAASQPRRWLAFAAVAGGHCLVVTCLAMTHSRSAWLAVAAGLGLLCATGGGTGVRRLGGWIIAGVTLLLVAAVAVILATDWPILASAKRSLTFRFEYWQATWQMICEHPWLGCGPGNFRDHYTRFMLPQASETIADPHNFLLEVWATAGTPAAVALVAIGVGVVWRVAKSEVGGRRLEERGLMGRAPLDVWCVPLGALAGAAVAFLLAWYFEPVVLMNYRWPVIREGMCLLGLAMFLLWPWVRAGRVAPLLPVLGAVALVIDLLAAGGIGYPGVAGSLWLLAAVALTLAAPPDEGRALPRPVALALLVALIAMTALCEWTALSPVMHAQMAIDEARVLRKEGDLARSEALLLEAAAADPLADQPLRELAQMKLVAWRAAPTDAGFAEFESFARRWLDRVPDSASAAKNVGDWYLAAWRTSPTPARIEAAVAAYRVAASRYPQSNSMAAHLAWAEHLAGNRDAAARDAATALRLDALNPHADRQLSGTLVRLADPDPETARTPPAQLMKRLVEAAGTKP